LIFGDSYLGYLSLMLVLPFLVFAMFRRFLPLSWAIALVTIFTAIPVGVLFGSSLVQYIKWAAKGFADPAAFVAFLAAFVLLVGRRETGPRDRFGAALGAGFLFALALFVRPNLAPAAGILLAGGGLAALWQGQFRRVLGLSLGFLPVLGMALHNWIYGGVLVLFTTTTTVTMSMPPSAYLAALGELLHFDWTGEHVLQALGQIAAWLAGPSESVVMAPLHAAAVIVLVRVVAGSWTDPRLGDPRLGDPRLGDPGLGDPGLGDPGLRDPWLRLTAGATLVQQGVGLFFLTAGRYYYLTWLLTLLVVAVWVHGEALDLVRKRWPKLNERVARDPAGMLIARELGRISRMVPSL
jgi:hypothetical protein